MTQAYKRPNIEELLSGNKIGTSRLQQASKEPEDEPTEAEESEGEEEESEDQNDSDDSKETSEPDKDSKEQDSKTDAEKMVSVEALQEARFKNRELRSENQKLKKELEALKANTEGDYYNTEPKQTAAKKDTQGEDSITSMYKEDRFNQSIARMKETREDHNKIFEKFGELCDADDQSRPEGEQSLWEKMYDHWDPGRFIIEVVEQSETASKYGTDVKTMKQKIRSELEKEITDKVAADLKKKYNIKTTLPTDVGGSRAASGSHEPYNRPKPDELWNRRRLGKQKRS